MHDAREELWECGYLQLVLLRNELLPVVEPLVPVHLPHHRDNGQWSMSPSVQHHPPPNARYLDIVTPVSAPPPAGRCLRWSQLRPVELCTTFHQFHSFPLVVYTHWPRCEVRGLQP